jgi:hypothetical protein
MLTITIPSRQLFNEEDNTFIETKAYDIRLEHSLVSISKWESKWQKPFLAKGEKTRAEIIDYVRCMTITQNVDPNAYYGLTQENVDAITKYIESPATATTIRQEDTKKSNEIVTSEIIYFWMITFNIPLECQTWHLNRLLTLINVCSIRNQPAKKVNRREQLKRQKALNDARKAKYNTPG